MYNAIMGNHFTSTNIKLIIVYEFVHGLLEFLLGLGMIVFGKQIIDLYQSLENSGFIQGSNGLLSNLLEKAAPYLLTRHTYIALLFIGLGIVKVISSIGLLYKKTWAAYLLIDFLILLIPLDLVSIISRVSIFRIFYLVANILVVLYLVGFDPKRYFFEHPKP